MSDQTIQFLLNNGVAVALLAAILFGVYMIGKAIAKAMERLFEHVAIPLKNAAIDHLERTNRHLEKTSEAIDSLRTTIEHIDRKLPPIR
jgi:uncharacterized protein YdgA (DUF945 family)